MSAWLESIELAGFDKIEANRIFGIPKINLSSSFSIKLRPPKLTRSAFQNRFMDLLEK